MSRKHYRAFAQDVRWTLQETRSTAEDRAVEALAKRMAVTFKEDNPRFSRGKFLAACGIDAA